MDMMQRGNLITVEDNEQYVIIKPIELDATTYAYVINNRNANDDGFVTINGDSLNVVHDEQIVAKLYKLL